MRLNFFTLIFLVILSACNSGGGGGGGGGIISTNTNTLPNTSPATQGGYVTSFYALPARITSSTSYFDYEVIFNKKITVKNCIPTIWIRIGGNLHLSRYTAGSGTKSHTYRVNFPNGAFDNNGPEIISPINASQECLIETDELRRQGVNLAFQTQSLTNVLINQIGPKLTDFELVPSSGSLVVGDVVTIKATFENNLTVQSSSVLSFNINSLQRNATYVSGSGSKVITYSYTIVRADRNLTQLTFGTAPSEAIDSFGNFAMNPDNSETFTYNISEINVAPVANDINPPSFNEDTLSNITLSYSDINEDTASTCEIVSFTNITIESPCTCNFGECQVGVKGGSNYFGQASFTYKVTAGDMTSNIATATLMVTTVDDPPTTTASSGEVLVEDIETMMTLTYQDTESHLASSCSVQNLQNLIITTPCSCISGTCKVGISGAENFYGNGSFNYTVSANGKTSNSSQVDVSVSPVNDAPITNNITPPTFAEGTTSTIELPYTDPEGDVATSCSVSNIQDVTIINPCSCLLGVCTITVAGAENYAGTASFEYSVNTDLLVSNTSTASLTIGEVDDAPVAENITPPAFDEDTISVIELPYTDIENNPATGCELSNLQNITITTSCTCADGECSVAVKGLENYNGAASFTYTVTANNLPSDPASANLTINSVEDAPIAADLVEGPIAEEASTTITLSYTDAESDLATSCELSNLTNISISEACTCADGICTIGVTGATNFSGNATFNYTVTANGLVSNSANVTVGIGASEDNPVVADFTAPAFDEDTQSIITLLYSDGDNDQATNCAITLPQNVTETQVCSCTDGVCTVGVTGLLNYNGAGSFSYTVTTNSIDSTPAVVSFTINPVDDAPATSDITVADAVEDTEKTINLTYNDVESDLATTCTVSDAQNITFNSTCGCVDGACSVKIQGTQNYAGTASFKYLVNANSKDSNPSTVNLNILPENDPPVANSFNISDFNEDTEVVVNLSYTDPENDQASTCDVPELSNVTIVENCACTSGSCSVKIKGLADYSGSGSLKFNVTTNGATSNLGEVTFNILPVNDAAVISDVTPSQFDEDTETSLSITYSDIEGDQATTCASSNPVNLTVVENCICTSGVCSLKVKGTTNHFGSASLDLTVSTSENTSEVFTKSFTINPIDDAPVTTAMNEDPLTEETEGTITLAYTDVESHQASVCTVSSLNHLTETTPCSCTSGVCTVGVTGANNYTGTASFDFNVTANGLPSNTSTVTFEISPINDAPQVSNFIAESFNEDTSKVITLPYTDGDNDLAQSCTLSNLTKATETIPCTCNVSGVCTVQITGITNLNGAGSFNYIVTTNGTASNTGLVDFTMNPVDDAPVTTDMTNLSATEGIEAVYTLTYSDIESDQATVCTVSNLTNITESTPCACSSGICTVGVTGTTNYSGAASFKFSVSSNGLTSNISLASINISGVDDPPVANNLGPIAMTEDTPKTITLSYSDPEADQAIACELTDPTNVSLIGNCTCSLGVCSVSVQGTENYTGSAQFSYTVTTGLLISNVANVSLNISPVNDPPVAQNFSPDAFNEDTEQTITLLYTEPESEQATSCQIFSPTNVYVTQNCSCLNGTCTVKIKGDLNYNGSASFTYRVAVGSVNSNFGQASLTINPVDDAPTATTVSGVTLLEDTAGIVTLNYSDIESDQATTCEVLNLNKLTVTEACACSDGVCTVGVKGILDYTGAASFKFKVTANDLTSNEAFAYINISTEDDAPVANNITPPAFNEDTVSTINLSYTDLDADLAQSCEISDLTNISIIESCSCSSGSCSVKVKGTLNYFGSAGFNYTVTANNVVSNSASASLTINAVDDAPVAQNVNADPLLEEQTATITLAYTDVESHEANSCVVSSLNNVQISTPCSCSSGTCSVGVTGPPNYNGPASFSFNLTANSLLSNSATVSFTINASADAPVANNITPTAFDEDTQSVITLSYTDGDNDQANACTLSNLTNVTVTQNCLCSNGECTVGITGTSNYNGAASFKYTVTANGDTSNAATASFTINPIDDAPVANNITPAAFNEDTEATITLSYTDVENDQASTCTISGQTNITVTEACACTSGTCSVKVLGSNNYNGSASFSYTVTTNSLTSNSALANLTIAVVDDAPVAINLTPAAFDEDIQSIITLSYTDSDGDQASGCTISNLSNITVTQACTCTLGVCNVGVTGTSNYNGIASFDYTVTSNTKTSNMATASLTVSSVPDMPVAQNITPPSFPEETESLITLSYTDGDGDEANLCEISGLSNVQETTPCSCVSGVCTVGVTGTASYSGSASFNFTVTANGDTSNSAVASLTITNVSDAPVASNLTPAAFNEDTQSIITLEYTDADGDQATLCTLSSLTNITVTQPCACSSGSCTVGVTGTLNYNGAASFNYTVTANGDTSTPASASLTINPVDDAPVANNITPAAFNENTQSIITLSYSDVENDKATICTIDNETNITVTQACACVDGACTVGVTGTNNYSGSASFTYIVKANNVDSNSATANLTINDVSTTPIANNITPAAFDEDTSSTITLSYSDPNGDLATTCTISGETKVSVGACNCSGSTCSVTVTGLLNQNGAASFNYIVNAGGENSNSATATFTLNAVDDAPMANDISPAGFDEDTESVITLSYSDVENHNATTCTISDESNVTVTQACACVDGNCTVGVTGTPNYDGLASFTYILNANGLNSNSATASLTINPVTAIASEANSSIIGEEGPIVANGTAASSITITLKDAQNNPIEGIVPEFSATDTNAKNTYGTCSITNALGISNCLLKSTKAEIKTLNLTYPITKAGNNVTFTAGAISELNSTITGTTSIIANGSAESQITITLKDAYNNPVADESPTFTATNTGTTNIYSTCLTTNSAGIYNCTLKSTKAEFKTLNLTAPITKTGSQVEFIAGPADPQYSTIEGTTPVTADGISPSFISITLKDAYQNPVVGVGPIFNATNTGSLNIQGACSDTNTSGIASCTLASTKAEEKTLQLTSPVAVTGAQTVTFIPVGPVIANSEITGTTNIIADGQTISTVTIVLRDINNDGVSGLTPTFDATNTGNGNTYGNCSITDLGGHSECTLKSTVAEIKTLRITSPILKSDGTVTFIAGPAVAANSTITGTTNILADGIETSIITITLKDQNNNLVSGSIPTFEATGFNNTASLCTATASAGVYTCTLKSTRAENKTLRITSPVTKDGEVVTFITGPADPDHSSISGTGPVLPDGTDTSSITITLKDINDNPIVGTIPTYSVSGSNNNLGTCSDTNVSGIATCSLSSTAAEIKTLTLTQPITKVGGTVEFKTSTAVAENSSITVNSGPFIANNSDSAAVTITLKDINNTGVAGIVPTFTASGSNNTLGTCSPTNSSGISNCTLKSTKAEIKNLSIATPFTKTGDSVTFIAGPASATYSTIAGTSPAYINTVQASTITITLKDAYQNLITNTIPTFTLSGTGNTLTTCTSTNESGTSTCYAASSVAETKTLTLTTTTPNVTSSIVFEPRGINLLVPIEMLDIGLASNTSDKIFQRTQTSFDPADYVAQTQNFYFEIVASNANANNSFNVSLVDSSNTEVTSSSIQVVKGTTTRTRIRKAFTPRSTAQIYKVKIQGSTYNSDLKVYSAKIIVEQQRATATKLYIPMLNGNIDGATDYVDTASVASTTSTTYTQASIPRAFTQWKRIDSNYNSIAQSNAWSLEAVISTAAASTNSASAALYNVTTGLAVTGAAVTQVGNQNIPSFQKVTFNGNATNFISGNTYELRIKSSSTSYSAKIYKAGLWLKLSSLTKAEVYNRIAMSRSGASSQNITDSRFLWNPSEWSNPQVFYETLGNSTTTDARLLDTGVSNSASTGTLVANSTVVQPLTFGITRSPQLTLTNGNSYIAQSVKNSTATAILGCAFIVIKVQE